MTRKRDLCGFSAVITIGLLALACGGGGLDFHDVQFGGEVAERTEGGIRLTHAGAGTEDSSMEAVGWTKVRQGTRLDNTVESTWRRGSEIMAVRSNAEATAVLHVPDERRGSITLVDGDQGVTSDTHQTQLGQIVFANNAIDFQQENPDSFVSIVRSDEPLYSRIYMSHSLTNTQGVHTMKLAIDGGPATELVETTVGSKEIANNHWTTFQMDLQDPRTLGIHVGYAIPWNRVVSELPAGLHRIDVEVWAGDKLVAVGHLLWDRVDGHVMSLLPESRYKGPDEPDIRKQVRDAVNAKMDSGVLDTEVLSEAFKVWTDNSGQRHRQISGGVVFGDKNNDGICQITYYNFISDEKNGHWTPLRFKSFCLDCGTGESNCPT